MVKKEEIKTITSKILENPELIGAIPEGWRQLSSGWYSRVFSNPDFPNLVLKVARSDLGHYRFLQFCKQHKSVHLPRIYWHNFFSLKMRRYDVTLMEKLIMDPSGDISHRWGYRDGMEMKHEIIDYYCGNKHAKLPGGKVGQVVKDLCDFVAGDENVKTDMHHHNMMLRENNVRCTVVITDPFSTGDCVPLTAYPQEHLFG